MSELIKYEERNGMSLPTRDWEVCDMLVGINQLRSFNLTGVEVLEYKDSLLRIMPDLDLAKLQFAIDRMMTGEIEYQKDKGIQNIFNALKRVEKNDEGQYYIKRQIW